MSDNRYDRPLLWISALLDWLLYTSVFASLCAVALCLATERLILGYIPPPGSALHLFIFGSAMVVYNVHHLVRKPAGSADTRSAWLQVNNRRNALMAWLGLLLSGAMSFYLPARVLLFCALLSVCSFAYSVPLLPFARKRRLKDFGWIKIWILSGVWTAVTAVLPMICWQQQMADFPVEIALRFVLMFILCLAFDIRDVQEDQEAGIFTLPAKIGLAATYRLIDIMILVFIGLCLLQYIRYGALVRFSGSVIAALLARIAIRYARRHPGNKVYLLYVDGVMLLYALLVLLH